MSFTAGQFAQCSALNEPPVCVNVSFSVLLHFPKACVDLKLLLIT